MHILAFIIKVMPFFLNITYVLYQTLLNKYIYTFLLLIKESKCKQ